ncbi:AAA family ATPase [Commensalibacter papalotli (ex Servin-Garciduenas et al. 2014)]|uniref:AAA+ ATPase domain-containing protein n=1 Tax=Commensalibacter papalotli (ex Servin-Garciduenas et al. 2014) TaxID=1208583 RepID=W7DVS1_9PROT|nr:ATP-binding protein [Commensalibacter papalotli (ex Servin-Garciduenas et al. 2014)]EUK19125.1 hypothetical protein COMX_05225 [Commensalibacter papalotli (ex Servin-Garciduenas et al. 2014)]
MKVKNIHIQNFKRFTDLTIEGIPETAKMVVLVGPNGCGKTSVFEAFNYQYNVGREKEESDYIYYNKDILSLSNISIKSECHFGEEIEETVLCFRSAFRNDPDVNIDKIEADHHLTDVIYKKLIHNDQRVAINYKRLIVEIIDEVLWGKDDLKTIKELRNEYTFQIKRSMQRIFDGLILKSIVPFSEANSFYFAKGNVEHYHYKNLSSGEKAVFDLLLDIIVNVRDYKYTVLFIDEPEAHIHTKLQGKLIEEIYNLFPDEGQLWITTHSLGIMTKAKELSIKYPGSVVFLDFDGVDFDQPVTLTPSPINQVVCQKFLSVALDGLEEKLAPEIIVLCEGSLEGKKRFNFDADIYTKIFQENYSNITFISGGSSNDLVQETKEFKMLSSVLDQKSKVIRLVDRDDHSDDDVIDLKEKEIFVISRRNIEGYLFDDELIQKLVIQENKQALLDQALAIKQIALQNSIDRGNPKDDLKKASGEIVTELKKLLVLTRCGNTPEAFAKNVILPLITPETEVYKEMEREIIQPILKASGH